MLFGNRIGKREDKKVSRKSEEKKGKSIDKKGNEQEKTVKASTIRKVSARKGN